MATLTQWRKLLEPENPDWNDLTYRAGGFYQCAVGEKLGYGPHVPESDWPKWASPEELDHMQKIETQGLYRPAMAFYHAIVNHDKQKALEIIATIEAA